MTRFANTALAACAALILSLGTIGAITAVPIAEATEFTSSFEPEIA